jgi:hypothetical protein
MFDGLFCKSTGLETSCYMWWDSVFSYCVFENTDLGSELTMLAEVIAVMSSILDKGCVAAKNSTIHGVEHLIQIYESTKSEDIRNMIVEHFDLKKIGLKIQ